jgi:hypothetical protein
MYTFYVQQPAVPKVSDKLCHFRVTKRCRSRVKPASRLLYVYAVYKTRRVAIRIRPRSLVAGYLSLAVKAHYLDEFLAYRGTSRESSERLALHNNLFFGCTLGIGKYHVAIRHDEVWRRRFEQLFGPRLSFFR